MYQKKAKQLNYLEEGESLPGGTSFTFMASTLIKLKTGAKLDDDKDFGIKGFKSTATILKSRDNESGRKLDLIYSQADGFLNSLTNWELVNSLKLWKGSGNGGFFIDNDKYPRLIEKVKKKAFKEKYDSDEEYRNQFNEFVRNEILIEVIPNVGKLDETLGMEELAGFTLVECVNEEQDIWIDSNGEYRNSEGVLVEVE